MPKLDLQTIGLTYDLVGILILGYPLVMKGMKSIISRSGTYWDNNPHEVRRMLEERIDVGLGTLVLVVGFGMQIVAVQCAVAMSPVLGWSLIAALIVCLVAYLAWIRRFVLARQEAHIRKEIEAKRTAEDEGDDAS